MGDVVSECSESSTNCNLTSCRPRRTGKAGQSYVFTAAGGTLTPGDTGRHEFTGYETQLASGLQYAGARFYDPTLGALLTHDPLAEFPNPYAYVHWDPVNATDPTGAFEIFTGALLLGLTLAGVVASAVQSALNGASAQQALDHALVGALGGLTFQAAVIGPLSSAFAGAATYAQGAQLAYGAYATAEGFRSRQYVQAGFGAVSLAYGLVGLAGGSTASAPQRSDSLERATPSRGEVCASVGCDFNGEFPPAPTDGTVAIYAEKKTFVVLGGAGSVGKVWATDSLGSRATFDTYSWGAAVDPIEGALLGGNGSATAFQVLELAGFSRSVSVSVSIPNGGVVVYEFTRAATYTAEVIYGGVGAGVVPATLSITGDYSSLTRFLPSRRFFPDT